MGNPSFALTGKGETQANGNTFSEREIGQIVMFAKTLERIHRRLESEGYIIKNGEIIPPKSDKMAL